MRRPAESGVLVPAALVLLAASVTMLARVWEGDLSSDEVLYAAVAKRMAVGGGWLDPQLGDAPYWKKPPLVFWLLGLAFRLIGISSFSARLVPAVFGVLTCVVLYLVGRRLVGERTALIGALVLATTPRFVRVAAHVNLDTAIALLTLVSLLPFVRAAPAAPGPRGAAVTGAAWGLALMAKSLFGLLGAYAMLVYLAAHRRLRFLASAAFLVAVLVAAAVALPWHVHAILRSGPDFVRTYLGQEVVARMTGHIAYAERHVYLRELLRDDWPWIAFTAIGIAVGLRRAREDGNVLFLIAWPVGYFLLLHLSAFRAGKYLVHLYAPAALLAAMGIEAVLPRRWLAHVLPATAVLVVASGLVLILVPFPLRRPTARHVKDLGPALDRLGAQPGAPLFGYRVHDDVRASSLVYLDRDIHNHELDEIPHAGAAVVVVDRRLSDSVAGAGFVEVYRNERYALFGASSRP